jgi:hypothetical protein
VCPYFHDLVRPGRKEERWVAGVFAEGDISYFLVRPLSEVMTLSVLRSYFIVPAPQEPRGVLVGHNEGSDTCWGRSM